MAIKIQGTTVIDDSRNATSLSDLSFNSLTLLGTPITSSAQELNHLSGTTSDVQTQIDALAKESATLNRTFSVNESLFIDLSSSLPSGQVPTVSVTKEVPQVGVTNNEWDVTSDGTNYTLHDTAYSTTLTPSSEIIYDFSLSSLTDSNKDTSISTASHIFMRSDGVEFYTSDVSTDSITRYTLSTPFDISSASLTNSFDVSTQTGLPQGVTFKDDGTKMYLCSNSSIIYEYNLTTAWDVTTASISNNFDHSSQTSSNRGLAFNNDGTRLFVVGIFDDRVFQFNLSTPWETNSAVYSGDSFLTTSEDGAPVGIDFDPTDQIMFIGGAANNSVFEYNLSSAGEISTATYSGNSLSVATNGYFVTIDQNNLYISDSDVVYQYSSSSTVNFLALGAGSFASTDVGKRIVGNGGEVILTATDGSYSINTAFNDTSTISAGDWSMFALDVESAAAGLTLSAFRTFYDIEAANYTGNSFDVSAQPGSPQKAEFSNDGNKMFVADTQNDRILEYDLAIPFDVSSASYSNKSFNLSFNMSSFSFDKNGTRLFVINVDNDTLNQFSLSQSFDLSNVTDENDSLSFSSEQTNPFGIQLNDSGTKVFIIGTSPAKIHQYSLSTAYDLTSGSYDNVELALFIESFLAFDFVFREDGKKLYIVGEAPNSVEQYGLTTAFDLSSASSDNITFSTGSELSGPKGISFSSDGSKMYIADSDNNSILEYNTGSSTAPTSANHTAITSTSTNTEFWTDINSMTADDASNDGSVFYAVSTDDRTTWKIINDAEGTERAIVRNNAGTWEVNDASDYGTETWVAASENDEFYALEEAVDISTAQSTIGFGLENASYDNVSFDISSQANGPEKIAFNNDGTKMYLVGNSSSSVYQYTLSSAFDLSTASYDSVSFSVSSQDSGPNGIAFNNDGSKMYIVGNTTDSCYQYSLSQSFDISTASYDSISFDVSSQASSPQTIVFNTDGTKMYVSGQNSGSVHQYTLSTSFDLSSASFDSISFNSSSEGGVPQDVTFNNEGTKMYTLGDDDSSVNQYTLSTAFDLSTASYDNITFSTVSQDSGAEAITFSSDGTKMYMVGGVGDSIFQYTTGSTTSTNRMDAAQLNAVSDASHYTLGDDLDLAVTLTMPDSGSTSPTSDGVSINYDANALNQIATLGTDYDYDFPAADTVRFTALSAENFKIRIA